MTHELLNGLFDYAGVFPPASHSVAEATARYRAARNGSHGWVLGPMLLRAGQLEEFEGDDPIGVVVDVEPGLLTGTFVQAERRVAPGAVATLVAQLEGVAPVIYLESDDAGDTSIVLEVAAVRRNGVDVRAKIRTGGATAGASPSCKSVADFISACVAHDVPFKATAGLHHPFRHVSDVDDAVEHGFVNVIAAVRCALAGEIASVVPCLEATDPESFDVTTMSWSGLGADVSAADVRRIFRSIGSCSFDEPAGYLVDLGVLEPAG